MPIKIKKEDKNVKNQKKFTCVVLAMAFISLSTVNCFAKTTDELNSSNDLRTSLLADLKASNSSQLNDYIKSLEGYTSKQYNNTVYVKIYSNRSDQEKAKNEKTVFTPSEYAKEITKEKAESASAINKFAINSISTDKNLNLTSSPSYSVGQIHDFGWVKIWYAVYALPGTPADFSVTACFEWQKIPNCQYTDVFSISHDSNSTFDNDLSRFVYYPDKSQPQYFHYYDKLQLNYPNESYNQLSLSGVYFPLIDTSIDDAVYGVNADTWVDYLKSSPKGFLTCFGHKANTTTQNTQLGIMYGHEQIDLSIKPSLSVSGTGAISMGTVVSIAEDYDNKNFVFSYQIGSNIFDPTD